MNLDTCRKAATDFDARGECLLADGADKAGQVEDTILQTDTTFRSLDGLPTSCAIRHLLGGRLWERIQGRSIAIDATVTAGDAVLNLSKLCHSGEQNAA